MCRRKEEEYIKRNSYEEFFREDLAEERVKESEREYFKEADQPSVQKINAKNHRIRSSYI